jgi:hypothetical protein
MVLENGQHQQSLHEFGRIQASVCADCQTVDWNRDGDPVDPWEALEEVIGQLRVVSRLPGISSPGPFVFVSARPRAGNRLLQIFEPGEWREIGPELYASTDGTHLLLSPVDATLGANLFATIGRG